VARAGRERAAVGHHRDVLDEHRVRAVVERREHHHLDPELAQGRDVVGVLGAGALDVERGRADRPDRHFRRAGLAAS
jgi:hypothetical protein